MFFAKTKDGARIHAEGRDTGEVHLIIDNEDEAVDLYKMTIENARDLIHGIETAIRNAHG